MSESLTLELPDPEAPLDLSNLARRFADIDGHAGFLADVAWLVRAFACLLDARRIGLRLRRLDRAMCPRYHVDHVPLRLITTYAGAGSHWLQEGQMPRSRLGDPAPSPLPCPSGRPWRPAMWRCSRARSGWATRGEGLSTGRRTSFRARRGCC